MPLIDHHEALQRTVVWGIPSSRAVSRELLRGSCYTHTFVLFSLAVVRGRLALPVTLVLSFLSFEDAVAVKQIAVSGCTRP
jgi:hypothetical protein